MISALFANVPPLVYLLYLVGFIFRPEVYKRDDESLRGLAELIVAKQRNGPVGKVDLVFLHSMTKFENKAEDIGDTPEYNG